jgi:hypothetical protein
LQESLEDTAAAVGHEAYRAALTFYKAVQQAAELNVPGADTIPTTSAHASPVKAAAPRRPRRRIPDGFPPAPRAARCHSGNGRFSFRETCPHVQVQRHSFRAESPPCDSPG